MFDPPGTVLATVTYSAPCPEGHPATWTSRAVAQKDRPHSTEADFDCEECPE